MPAVELHRHDGRRGLVQLQGQRRHLGLGGRDGDRDQHPRFHERPTELLCGRRGGRSRLVRRRTPAGASTRRTTTSRSRSRGRRPTARSRSWTRARPSASVRYTATAAGPDYFTSGRAMAPTPRSRLTANTTNVTPSTGGRRPGLLRGRWHVGRRGETGNRRQVASTTTTTSPSRSRSPRPLPRDRSRSLAREHARPGGALHGHHPGHRHDWRPGPATARGELERGDRAHQQHHGGSTTSRSASKPSSAEVAVGETVEGSAIAPIREGSNLTRGHRGADQRGSRGRGSRTRPRRRSSTPRRDPGEDSVSFKASDGSSSPTRSRLSWRNFRRAGLRRRSRTPTPTRRRTTTRRVIKGTPLRPAPRVRSSTRPPTAAATRWPQRQRRGLRVARHPGDRGPENSVDHVQGDRRGRRRHPVAVLHQLDHLRGELDGTPAAVDHGLRSELAGRAATRRS